MRQQPKSTWIRAVDTANATYRSIIWSNSNNPVIYRTQTRTHTQILALENEQNDLEILGGRCISRAERMEESLSIIAGRSRHSAENPLSLPPSSPSSSSSSDVLYCCARNLLLTLICVNYILPLIFLNVYQLAPKVLLVVYWGRTLTYRGMRVIF